MQPATIIMVIGFMANVYHEFYVIHVFIGSPMVCGCIWFLSSELCAFYPQGRIEKTHWVDKNHIQPQTMGDSFYHMLQHHFYLYITLQ